jgi:hypothetical protein
MTPVRPERETLEATIREALDLGLQAWRTTPTRERFHAAFDALAALAVAPDARLADDLAREVQGWCYRDGLTDDERVCGIAELVDLHLDAEGVASPAAPDAREQVCPICQGCCTVPTDFYSRLGASTSTAREKCRRCDGLGTIPVPVARLAEALARAGAPLEVLRAQIETKPYAEITEGLQAEIIAATEIVRAALAAAREETRSGGDTDE